MIELINNVDAIILSFVQGSFGALTGTVQILWRMMFIVFIAIYGYKIMISGRFSMPDLMTHCVKIIMLLSIATQWDLFFLLIFNMATNLPSSIAGQIMQAASNSYGANAQANSSITANAALSLFFDRGMSVSANILQGAGWGHIGQYLYALAIWLGTIGLTAYATMLIILSKLAVALLMAIGPLFILLLMFAGTKALFEGWLRTLLNYAVVPIFVYVLLAILLVLIEGPLQHLERNNGVYDELITVVGPFLLTSIVSILLLSQILNMAASITGGVSLSTMGLMRWTNRHALTGPGAKASSAAGKWGWQKTAPLRENAVMRAKNTIKTGRAMMVRSLQKTREVH